MLFHYSRFSHFIRRRRIIYAHIICLKEKYNFVSQPAGSSSSFLGIVCKYCSLECHYLEHISRTISFSNIIPLYYNACAAKTKLLSLSPLISRIRIDRFFPKSNILKIFKVTRFAVVILTSRLVEHALLYRS